MGRLAVGEPAPLVAFYGVAAERGAGSASAGQEPFLVRGWAGQAREGQGRSEGWSRRPGARAPICCGCPRFTAPLRW